MSRPGPERRPSQVSHTQNLPHYTVAWQKRQPGPDMAAHDILTYLARFLAPTIAALPTA